MERLAAWEPRVLSILRIVAALAFMLHGTMKHFDFPAAMEGAPDPLPVILVVAGWLEIVGGALLALGLFTRPAAFVLSGMMAVAYFMAHATKGLYPILNGGEPALLYCFVFFYFVFAGGGAWSLDAALARRKAAAA